MGEGRTKRKIDNKNVRSSYSLRRNIPRLSPFIFAERDEGFDLYDYKGSPTVNSKKESPNTTSTPKRKHSDLEVLSLNTISTSSSTKAIKTSISNNTKKKVNLQIDLDTSQVSSNTNNDINCIYSDHTWEDTISNTSSSYSNETSSSDFSAECNSPSPYSNASSIDFEEELLDDEFSNYDITNELVDTAKNQESSEELNLLHHLTNVLKIPNPDWPPTSSYTNSYLVCIPKRTPSPLKERNFSKIYSNVKFYSDDFNSHDFNFPNKRPSKVISTTKVGWDSLLINTKDASNFSQPNCQSITNENKNLSSQNVTEYYSNASNKLGTPLTPLSLQCLNNYTLPFSALSKLTHPIEVPSNKLISTQSTTDGPKFLRNLAYLCDGLSTRKSTLGRPAGLGLFADRHFYKNQVITEYCGTLIDRETALQLRELGASTHVIRVDMPHSYISGYQYPIPFIGGGSFANDGRKGIDGKTKGPGNNAQHYVWFDHRRGRERVFIKATKDISKNDEILIDYHNVYWNLHKSK